MKKAPFDEIAEKFQIDPLTARLIRNRDIEGEEAIRQYLYGGLESLHSPWLFLGMEQAVSLLRKKIEAGKRIRVIGDYDIDGVCATYILLQGLTALGATADWDIPDRIRDGYGLNVRLVQQAYNDGIDTILTCDNGIAASDQIAKARALGMTVIVTDHHEVPFTQENGEKQEYLPPANVVIDPKQAKCSYPFSGVCGAVVAWKLVQALYERAHLPEEACMSLLPFAAIATVGDVMDLKEENRIIVKRGLEMLRSTTHPGLRALMEVNHILPQEISAYHIGFVLGPCLNAGGRLHTAKLALRLLQCKDRAAAISCAEDLKALNEARKELTKKAVEQAKELLEQSGRKEDSVLVVYLPDCHESIAGIVAGRIREQYNKPVFVLTKGEQCVKGSGRSIEAYSMFEKLSACREFLLQFGGHPMAAGLSLEEKNLEPLRRKLNEQCELVPDDFVQRVEIDAAMPVHYLSEKLIREFSLLEPFGKGNVKPLFAEKELTVLSAELFGRNRNVLRLRLQNAAGVQIGAVCFQEAQSLYAKVKSGGKLTAAYYPEIKEFRGKKTLQIVITHFRTCSLGGTSKQ